VRLNTTWAVLSGEALVRPMRKEGASQLHTLGLADGVPVKLGCNQPT
jgi:hypothetical protein